MRHATRQRHLKHLHKTTHYRRNCYFHSCNPSEHADVETSQPYIMLQEKIRISYKLDRLSHS